MRVSNWNTPSNISCGTDWCLNLKFPTMASLISTVGRNGLLRKFNFATDNNIAQENRINTYVDSALIIRSKYFLLRQHTCNLSLH